MRSVSAAVVACVLLTSCTPTTPFPRPTGTLEPSITESSPTPTADKNNVACRLLTAEERSDMVGYSLNSEVPVRPDPGTEQCLWIHSLREPARAAVRVTVLRTEVWARQIAPQIRAAIVKPTTTDSLRAKLKDALADLLTGGGERPTEEICEAYLLLAESNGAVRSDQQVYFATIGAMPAAFGIACEDGIMTIAGYGEYGIRPSLALSRGVAKLVGAAGERAPEALAGGGDQGDAPEDDVDAANPSPAPRETIGEESPSPTEPPETSADDSEDEDES